MVEGVWDGDFKQAIFLNQKISLEAESGLTMNVSFLFPPPPW